MEEKSPKVGTLLELSELLGVSAAAITKAVKNGRISEHSLVQKKPPKVILAEAILEWFANTEQSKSRADFFKMGKPLSSIPTRQQSEQVKAYFEAKEATRQDSKKEGDYLPTDDTVVKVQRVFKTLRDRLLSVGNAVASVIAPDDPTEVRILINKEIEDCLREFCTKRMGLN